MPLIFFLFNFYSPSIGPFVYTENCTIFGRKLDNGNIGYGIIRIYDDIFFIIFIFFDFIFFPYFYGKRKENMNMGIFWNMGHFFWLKVFRFCRKKMVNFPENIVFFLNIYNMNEKEISWTKRRNNEGRGKMMNEEEEWWMKRRNNGRRGIGEMMCEEKWRIERRNDE